MGFRLKSDTIDLSEFEILLESNRLFDLFAFFLGEKVSKSHRGDLMPKIAIGRRSLSSQTSSIILAVCIEGDDETLSIHGASWTVRVCLFIARGS